MLSCDTITKGAGGPIKLFVCYICIPFPCTSLARYVQVLSSYMQVLGYSKIFFYLFLFLFSCLYSFIFFLLPTIEVHCRTNMNIRCTKLLIASEL